MSFSKMSSSLLESRFPKVKHNQHFPEARTYHPNDAILSDNSDFENATKTDPSRNVSYSASVCSLSCQNCLSFQFLGLSRAIDWHDEDGGAIQCVFNGCNPVQRSQGEPIGWRRLFRTEFVCECEIVSDGDMIDGMNAQCSR
jgi:hypothetical protein